MKKIYSLLFLVIASVSFGQTIYTENFGTPTGTTAIATYSTQTAPATFQNASPIAYSGTGDVRASSASTGYIASSGGGNIFLTNTAGRNFIIDGLNTSSVPSSNIVLSFGYLTSVITSQLLVEQSVDGTNWTAINFTQNTNTSWTLVSIPGGQVVSSSTLKLRFTQPAATTAQMRIDDVKLTNFNPACTLVLGTDTTSCNASTLNLDTYTLTIPFTGAGNATYTRTTTSGTISGDNPSTVASGNIIILNITEGMAVTVTVTGGSCNFTRTVNSPDCKPVNTIPYSENFPYTVSSSLGASQKWATVNTGDNVTLVTGNLNYTGLNSTGNSVSFSGAGAEAFTPFTTTTSGTLYTSFLLSVTDQSNVTLNPASETYFAGITGTLSADYRARVFVKNLGTTYQIGFDTASTTTNYDTTIRNNGDSVLVIVGYDFTANSLKAWINPVLATFNSSTPATFTITPTTPIVNIGGFILRQDGATSTPFITVDELRVVLSPNDLLGTSQNSIEGLSIYPNPVTNGTLFITSNANASKNIVIYDVLGKQVLNTTTDTTSINVAGLNAGVYIVKVTEEGKSATRKLVIR